MFRLIYGPLLSASALSAVLVLAGCNEETTRRIEFSNCLNGLSSPDYAEVAKACAEIAIKKRATQAAKQGEQP